jgi:glucose-6-phosphate isomerase
MDQAKLIMKPGSHTEALNNAFNELKRDNIVERIWEKDFNVWSNEPTEITNRLGWLTSPQSSLQALGEIEEFVKGVREEKFEKILLMGMGGSSLAPEVFSLTFGSKEGYPELHVIDSTDPDVVSEYDKVTSDKKTLFIVSTKSGGTVETFSFMKYFFNKTLKKIGKEEVGKRFGAVTDPGSGLEKTAKDLNFRKIFLNDPDIGGRYSALSFFGVVPAALIGLDIEKLLNRAEKFARNSVVSDSVAGKLGSAIGEYAKLGIDKLTFILSEEVSSFGAWVEQLIAESTGKRGKGILPVEGEAVQSPDFYSNDRLFVYIHFKNDNRKKDAVQNLSGSGFPVFELILDDLYDLGEQYFLWEIVTVVAGWRLGIQPFDQPDVESAKILARQMVKEYQAQGKLPEQNAFLSEGSIRVFGDLNAVSFDTVLREFLNNSIEKNGYIGIQAYIKPDNDSLNLLQELRLKIAEKYKTPVTIGFGPRFLHSTGQLHKGDAGKGVFIQFTSSSGNDLSVPDNPGEDKSSISFGVLKSAQALGDRQALLNKNRKVLRFDLGTDVITGLKRVSDSF